MGDNFVSRIYGNLIHRIGLSPGQTRKHYFGNICDSRRFLKWFPVTHKWKHCCGNICDSRCFLKCFPVCPPMETWLGKQNLLSGKESVSCQIQKDFMFPKNDFCCGKIVSKCLLGKLGETLAVNNYVSAKCFLD